MRTDLLIDQLAELAGQRNRDALDACFLGLFTDLLQPQDLAIYRMGSDEQMPRWQVQRRGSDGTAPPQREQPPLQALPVHLDAWTGGQLTQHPDDPAVALVPMGCHQDTDCLIEVRSDQPLTADQMRLIVGIQRFHRHLRALIDENERDALTRLLNRKSFNETFGRMALHLEAQGGVALPADHERRRSAEPTCCWLAVLDLDHFKRVNDRFGHLIGDEVLILVSQQLRQTFRGCDQLYRFGGEEFVVLLHAPRQVDAAAAFERLRQNIESTTFPQVGRLTVSIGFTEVRPVDTPSSAFERADQAVYHAKGRGRNQVVCHEALVRDGEVAAPSTLAEFEFF